MWQYLFYFVILIWTMFIILISCIHFNGFISNKSIFIDYSILVNFDRLMNFKKKPSFSIENSFHLLRCGGQLFILFVHFSLANISQNISKDQDKFPLNILTFITFLILMRIYYTLIVISGISTAKWFINQFNTDKGSGNAIIVARFFFSRWTNLSISYYLVVIFWVIYLNYIVDDDYKEDVAETCNESFISLLTFTSNFLHDKKEVKINYLKTKYNLKLKPINDQQIIQKKLIGVVVIFIHFIETSIRMHSRV